MRFWSEGDLCHFDGLLGKEPGTGLIYESQSPVFQCPFSNIQSPTLVAGGGFEPPTQGFSVPRSTPELPGRNLIFNAQFSIFK